MFGRCVWCTKLSVCTVYVQNMIEYTLKDAQVYVVPREVYIKKDESCPKERKARFHNVIGFRKFLVKLNF